MLQTLSIQLAQNLGQRGWFQRHAGKARLAVFGTNKLDINIAKTNTTTGEPPVRLKWPNNWQAELSGEQSKKLLRFRRAD